jgi:hypothetical protein
MLLRKILRKTRLIKQYLYLNIKNWFNNFGKTDFMHSTI